MRSAVSAKRARAIKNAVAHSPRTYPAGRTIWVIGASSGIGSALARQLAAFDDVRLLLSARNQARLEAVAASCRERGALCRLFPFALDEAIDGERIYQQASAHFAGIDCVLFVAGTSQRAHFADAHMSVLSEVMQANFLAHVAIAHACARARLSRAVEAPPRATEAGTGCSHLLFVGSLAGYVSTPLRSMYSASKAALHSFAETLMLEMKPHNVKVQLVIPGFVRTDISRNALQSDGSRWQKMDKNQQQGMAVELCAKRIISFLMSKSFILRVGFGVRGGISMLLRRISPALLRKLVARARTT